MTEGGDPNGRGGFAVPTSILPPFSRESARADMIDVRLTPMLAQVMEDFVLVAHYRPVSGVVSLLLWLSLEQQSTSGLARFVSTLFFALWVLAIINA